MPSDAALCARGRWGVLRYSRAVSFYWRFIIILSILSRIHPDGSLMYVYSHSSIPLYCTHSGIFGPRRVFALIWTKRTSGHYLYATIKVETLLCTACTYVCSSAVTTMINNERQSRAAQRRSACTSWKIPDLKRIDWNNIGNLSDTIVLLKFCTYKI